MSLGTKWSMANIVLIHFRNLKIRFFSLHARQIIKWAQSVGIVTTNQLKSLKVSFERLRRFERHAKTFLQRQGLRDSLLQALATMERTNG